MPKTRIIQVIVALALAAPLPSRADQLVRALVGNSGGSMSNGLFTLVSAVGMPAAGDAANVNVIEGAGVLPRTGALPVGVPDPGTTSVANALRLAGANPFHGAVRLACSVAPGASGHARLEILDVEGRRVATLLEGGATGRYQFDWSGRDAFGRPAPCGIYLARLTAGNEQRTVRVVRLN